MTTLQATTVKGRVRVGVRALVLLVVPPTFQTKTFSFKSLLKEIHTAAI
jgi:hypothetical protein